MRSDKLPDMCYTYLEDSDIIGKIKKGVLGVEASIFNRICKDKLSKVNFVIKHNEEQGITKPIEAAMLAGALRGFEHPDANPMMYDLEGKHIRSNNEYWTK